MQGIFEGVIGAYSMGDVCKPEHAAFQKAIDICGADPKNIAMFEDSFKNLRTAKELGMASLLCCPQCSKVCLAGNVCVDHYFLPIPKRETEAAHLEQSVLQFILRGIIPH